MAAQQLLLFLQRALVDRHPGYFQVIGLPGGAAQVEGEGAVPPVQPEYAAVHVGSFIVAVLDAAGDTFHR